MLQSLLIKNYAIIDQLEIEWQQGMTVITGETGAGKSIIIGALQLVLGNRSDVKALRNPDENALWKPSSAALSPSKIRYNLNLKPMQPMKSL